MLKLAKSLIRRTVLYESLRGSSAHEVYLHVFRPKMTAQLRRELKFYRQALSGLHPGDLVFDVGANEGYKTGLFVKLGARVVSVEPDEACISLRRRRFRRKPVTVVPKAASAVAGTTRFHITRPGSTLNTLSDKWVEALEDNGASRFGPDIRFQESYEVETVTVDQLIAQHGVPRFLKIDVEGHELSVLRGLSQPVPLVAFELNLPEFRAEGLKCVDHLERLNSRSGFNYVVADRFEATSWLSSSHFKSWLEGTDLRYLEVYARTDVVSSSQAQEACLGPTPPFTHQ